MKWCALNRSKYVAAKNSCNSFSYSKQNTEHLSCVLFLYLVAFVSYLCCIRDVFVLYLYCICIRWSCHYRQSMPMGSPPTRSRLTLSAHTYICIWTYTCICVATYMYLSLSHTCICAHEYCNLLTKHTNRPTDNKFELKFSTLYLYRKHFHSNSDDEEGN